MATPTLTNTLIRIKNMSSAVPGVTVILMPVVGLGLGLVQWDWVERDP